MQEKIRRLLFQVVLFLNIAAVFAGAYYYWGQLSSTQPQLLIFVPDCPLYVLLALPILLKWVKNSAYSFLVSASMVKYGLWTVFVLLYHSNYYFLPSALAVTAVFIIGHLGMALEGIALLPSKKVGAAVLLLTVAWFLLNDYADYFLGTVPPIPGEGMGTVAFLTISSSILLPLALYFFARQLRSLAPIRLIQSIIRS